MSIHINGWFRASSTATRLTVRSRAYELVKHYLPRFGSCRCQVAGCELCEQLGEPTKTLVHVVERGGAMFLLELNCDAMEKQLVVGDQIVIQRRKLGDYSETFIRRDGFEGCSEIWPANYLAALGQKAYERAVSGHGGAMSL